MELVDFTNCRLIPGRTYNGANGKKIAIDYDGALYMLKFPSSGAVKPTELSYTNSCISEHIASTIFNLLGIPAQETMLGTFRVKDKTKVVCACKDFTADGKRFFDFCSLKNTVLDSESGGRGTELEDILDTIQKQKYFSPPELEAYFWDLFVVDAFLGNFDRHNGNWGFLFDDGTGEASIAPVFDCGSCLLPQADEKVMRSVLDNEKALHARIFQFPTSAVKQGGRKINYYDFLTSAEYSGCCEAVKRVVPKIDFDRIDRFISGVPFISELQKEFYKRYIQERFALILKPALDIVEAGKQKSGGSMISL